MGDFDSLSNTELKNLFEENKYKCDEYNTIKNENTSRMPTRTLTHVEINKEEQLKKRM
jgi:thiamine pyrophosphokinase